MKKLSRFKLTARLVIATGILNAQDTICFKTNEKIAIKVVEIDISSITYKLTENNDGPNYVTDKNSILYIKFSNGQIDSIKPYGQSIHETQIKKIKIKISIDGKKLTFDGKTINNNLLFNLIDKCDSSSQKIELQKAFLKMSIYNENRKVIAPIVLVAGFAIPFVTSSSALQNKFLGESISSQQSINLFIGGVIGGAIVRITACAISSINKNKYWHQRNEIAKMYNDIP